MSAPTYHERCNAEFLERASKDSRTQHVCYVQAGHGGDHKCGCGFEWEDEWEDIVSVPNPAVQEVDLANGRLDEREDDQEGG